MGAFDHLVQAAWEITQASGPILKEQVGLYDLEKKGPGDNRKGFNVESIVGDTVHLIRETEDGSDKVRLTVRADEIFAVGAVLALHNGYGADLIIASRQSVLEKQKLH